ncbi:MAG: hypothetical protein KKD35_05745 [Elusimicrobia bacterium]|nr:hypothetical protein [Elusimicrobiota bacterium]
MEIKHFKDKNGREWVCGKGTADEVDRLNIEKDFNTTLNMLQSIRKTRHHFFQTTESTKVDRSICGKRKAI